MRKISIAYCGTCNYRPIAASLARVIETETGLKPELVHSPEIGAFEVTISDELIFSKKAVGRFPDFTKVIEAIAGQIGSSE